MEINILTGVVLDACIKIHTAIGRGCFEKVYEEVLYYELVNRDLYI
jgi:GxxExxY protein